MAFNPSKFGGAGLVGCPSGNRYEHIHVRFSQAILGLRNFRKDNPPAPCHTLGAGVRTEELKELAAYLFKNSSLPISIRRISDVPAPIS
ncbi:hypothetical protein GCM10011362_26330 [Marinobacter halophilus]|nr:hypothetical protein GCM10011362_26330 [Marinobacter halophilus]